jgi:hypothetical protein
MPQEKELGGPIYDVKYFQGDARIRFGKDVERKWKESEFHNSMPMAPKGSHVWKTADAEIGEKCTSGRLTVCYIFLMAVYHCSRLFS